MNKIYMSKANILDKKYTMSNFLLLLLRMI